MREIERNRRKASDLAGNQAPTAGFVVTASTPDTPRFDDDAS